MGQASGDDLMRPLVDWRRLLQDEGVYFIERGPNVKRGEINIKCPFCGTADPSQHMGLNLETGWWSCWRNRRQHSGKSPVRLLVALLRIPYWKAREIAGLEADYVDPDGFSALASRLLGRSIDVKEGKDSSPRFLDYPESFQPVSAAVRCRHYWDYLERRGFTFISELIELYDLQCDPMGEWRGRVILPYEIDRHLVAWTGRAIADASIRYKDLADDQCVIAPKHTLFNYDCIAKGGRVLVIAEGPFDALKIDFYGESMQVRSVALSTATVSDDQAFMLEEAVDQFDRIYLMMDNASQLGIVDSLRLRSDLGFIPGIKTLAVPFGLKDAGELSPRQALEWTELISKEDPR